MAFNKFVKIRREKFGAVVFDTRREKVFVTNHCGADILKHLQEGLAPADITPLLARDYQQSPAGIQADISAFMEKLSQRELLSG